MASEASTPEAGPPVQFCPNCGAAMTAYLMPEGSRREGPRIIECRPCGILKTEVMPRDD